MGSRDLEAPPLSSPLLLPSDSEPEPAAPRRASRYLCVAISSALAFAFFVYHSGMVAGSVPTLMKPDPAVSADRGVRAGVSHKSFGPSKLKTRFEGPYPWTNKMLSWQRTGFHFQPENNWMNDPNGPMYYKGLYHFFYQYNPDSAVWGNISWGHAVSKDLLHWTHLPVAMVPDQWYDEGGVWTGSATILPDGRVVMLYTGGTNESVQVQNLAVPADPSDPLLREWVKSDANPVLFPPSNIDPQDFRDPSTAWYEPSDSTWRIVIGSKDSSHNGIAFVYSTKDFISYTLLSGVLHTVEKVGMWECVDLYPIATSGSLARNGLDPSARPSNEVKHVLKASTQDNNSDYYAIGTYDPIANTWTPDNEAADVGIGWRYDWGNFYASKTFYDQGKQRRILWGWIKETDSEYADILKGWASLQGIPRTILFDMKTRSHLLTWPVEEVESLRTTERDFSGITIGPGSTFELDVGGGAQLDIEAEFKINNGALNIATEANSEPYECSTSGGAATRGVLGPFGLLVLANRDLTEQTATYFYISRGLDGNLQTHICQDELRSSKASDIVKGVVGNTVPVVDGEMLSLRILVDHSIVESFAQGGRASATSRVYPTEAIYNSARVFLFNNATSTSVTAQTLKIWQMKSTKSNTLHFPNL
uniref:Vacuolar invertase 1 n=1 Tax=Hemerocallis fulva TaxID=34190 RepID=A0A8E5MMW2_HEMFU|nr:vacuolar invertase 1 [Hemerocallis fulva]